MDQNQPPYGQLPPPPVSGQPPYGQYGQQPYGQPPHGQLPPYGGDPYYYTNMVPRPGCIPLRPLSVGEIIGGVFNAIGRTWKLLLAFSGAIAVLQFIATFLINLGTTGGRSRTLVDNSDPNNPVFHWSVIGSQSGLLLGDAAVYVFLTSLLTAPLALVFLEDVVGRRASLGFLWSRLAARLGPVLLLALAVGVLEAVGLGLCIVPGLLLWGVWTAAVPALMVERLGVREALIRSRNLTRGMFWRVWGVRALGYAISWGIGWAVGIIFGLIAYAVDPDAVVSISFGGGHTQHLPAGVILILSVGAAVGFVVDAPVRAGIDSLLYVDLRMRKEGLANDLQRAASQSR